jgi:alpha/beta superfamily hydrolase
VSTNETFDLAGPVGRLEAILMLPDGAPQAAAVVCHAHPLQGGVMHFKVVFRVAKALQAENMAALRFNFRGVGRSEGHHDEGRGEQDDVGAALDELTRRFPGLPLLAAGFSFGSVMALRAGCADERVRALIALGFPISMVKDPSFLNACTRPRLFVQGADDVFGPGPILGDLVAKLPEPKVMVVVPAADHFFSGHLEPMQEAVRAWVATHPWEAR